MYLHDVKKTLKKYKLHIFSNNRIENTKYADFLYSLFNIHGIFTLNTYKFMYLH